MAPAMLKITVVQMHCVGKSLAKARYPKESKNPKARHKTIRVMVLLFSKEELLLP